MQKKGKAMNIEELRINKQLLKEISKRKKEKIYNSQEKVGSVTDAQDLVANQSDNNY